MVNLVRDAISEGMTLDEISQALGISRKRCKRYLAHLTAHGRDFGYIWDSFVAQTDLTSKRLLQTYNNACSEENTAVAPIETLKIQRDTLVKRMDLHRNLVEMAIAVGYLQVEKERSLNAGEAQLEKVAEAVMVKLMERKRSMDAVRAAQDQADAEAEEVPAIEVQVTNGNGSSNGHDPSPH